MSTTPAPSPTAPRSWHWSSQLIERLERAGLTDVAVALHHRGRPILPEHGSVEYDTEGVTYRPDEFVERLLAVSQSQ